MHQFWSCCKCNVNEWFIHVFYSIWVVLLQCTKSSAKNNQLFFHATTAQCLATSVAWAWNIFLTGLLRRGFVSSKGHGSYYLHVCIMPSAQGACVEDFSLSPVSRWVPGLRFPDLGAEIERTWTTDSTTSTLHILRINFLTDLTLASFSSPSLENNHTYHSQKSVNADFFKWLLTLCHSLWGYGKGEEQWIALMFKVLSFFRYLTWSTV